MKDYIKVFVCKEERTVLGMSNFIICRSRKTRIIYLFSNQNATFFQSGCRQSRGIHADRFYNSVFLNSTDDVLLSLTAAQKASKSAIIAHHLIISHSNISFVLTQVYLMAGPRREISDLNTTIAVKPSFRRPDQDLMI